MTEARCMHCRKQVEIKDSVESLTSKGIRIAKGTCPICGTKVARLLGKPVEVTKMFGIGKKKNQQVDVPPQPEDEPPMRAALDEEHPKKQAMKPQPGPQINPELQGFVSQLEQDYPVSIPMERLGQVMFAVYCELVKLNQKSDEE